jgi:hypothetical protein
MSVDKRPQQGGGSDPLDDSLKRAEAKRLERIRQHEAIKSSKEYKAQLTYIGNVTRDAIDGFKVCWAYSYLLAFDFASNSLMIRSSDDVVDSILASYMLLHEGFHYTLRRELRFIVETAVKSLYVDQQTALGNPALSVAERIQYLHDHVDRSSIDVREKLVLHAFDAATTKQLVSELNDVYRNLCGYVHVSRKQIEERMALAEVGRSPGFETADELRSTGRLMFRVYDLVLALYFHGFGLSLVGDAFVQILDERPEWKFHKGKYVKKISSYFNYKSERRRRSK